MLFAAHNATGHAIQLLSANIQLPRAGALQLLGVRLTLAPPPPNGDLALSGLRPPYGRLPSAKSVLIPPDHDAWVQLNFSERYCLLGQPTTQTYNQHADLRYRTRAATRTMKLDLRGDQITMTAPLCSYR